MADVVAAFDFLTAATPPVPPVCMLFGDEPFLKHESLTKIKAAVLAGDDAELCFTELSGSAAGQKELEARELFDELATVSMFGGERRLVLLSEGDKFVTKHRERLEDYVEKPRGQSVLVLEVSSFPATTRLYKKVAATGLLINCGLPKARWGDGIDEAPVLKWLTRRAADEYAASFGNSAAELLLEIVGPHLGRLDQELAKLALLAKSSAATPPEIAPQPADKKTAKAKGPVITKELVEQSVGGWVAKTAWAMIESALEGRAGEALVQLDRLLLAGEEPIALLGMMGGSLRRLAAATRIYEQAEADRRRIGLSDALIEAGVKNNKFVLGKTEGQLKLIGRARGQKIYGWLLEADLALKGTAARGTGERRVLEKLIVHLSKQATPAKS